MRRRNRTRCTVLHRPLTLAALWLVASVAGAPVIGQPTDPEPKAASVDPGLKLPAGLDVDLLGKLTQMPDGGARFEGPVTVRWRESRFQADLLVLREGRHIEAEGNVLIVWGRNRIFGSRMTYDLKTERGVIEDAMGYALDQYLFWAKKVEKIGEDRLLLRSAVITTCTQPLPYWSFAVSSARIRLEKYARMRNVRLRFAKAPLFYLPYIVWPVKDGRAAGLLMPDYGTTQTRGEVFSQELFIPLGRSADVTLLGRYYTEAGFGGGGEARWIPNATGSARLSGFYINDLVDRRGRYRADYEQTQKFRNGFRMLADMHFVSDEQYFADFERDLDVVASPQVLARLEFSRNGPWTSLNVRELRREQLASGLVQQTLPEIEWRGRSKRLGSSPFYLSFESSLASIQQRERTAGDADYLRGDLSPEFSLPWSPTRWLDITPRVRHRWTVWSQRQSDGGVADDSLRRSLWSYGIEVVGPKLFRIYEGSGSGARYKHTLETRITYGFAESFDEDLNDAIIRYDEVDSFNGAGEQMDYALVQRLFAKRPRARQAEPGGDETLVTEGESAESAAPPDSGADRPVEPVEIASLQISQRRSFDEDLSRADLDEDGELDAFSSVSPIQLSGRINPRPTLSFDVRGTYDILWDRFRSVSVSGNLRNRVSSIRFSLFHQNGLGVTSGSGGALVPVEDSTQVRLTTGFELLRGKLLLNFDGSYDANPPEGRSRFPNQLWQAQYRTQCCTVFVERLTRDLGISEDRRELRLRVDLTGLGQLFKRTF